MCHAHTHVTHTHTHTHTHTNKHKHSRTHTHQVRIRELTERSRGQLAELQLLKAEAERLVQRNSHVESELEINYTQMARADEVRRPRPPHTHTPS